MSVNHSLPLRRFCQLVLATPLALATACRPQAPRPPEAPPVSLHSAELSEQNPLKALEQEPFTVLNDNGGIKTAKEIDETLIARAQYALTIVNKLLDRSKKITDLQVALKNFIARPDDDKNIEILQDAYNFANAHYETLVMDIADFALISKNIGCTVLTEEELIAKIREEKSIKNLADLQTALDRINSTLPSVIGTQVRSDTEKKRALMEILVKHGLSDVHGEIVEDDSSFAPVTFAPRIDSVLRDARDKLISSLV